MKGLCIALLCIVALGGCLQPADSFVKAIDGHTTIILPEYRAYVQADPKLSDTDKEIRTASCDALVQLIETAKKGGE